MHPKTSHAGTRSRLDFENGFVLLIGWVVALAVTWT
jgi:hypothetical protein